MNDQSLGDLIDVRHTRLLVIHDAWSGYNPLSPATASYDLRRTHRGGFKGEGRFSTSESEQIVPVTIPIAVSEGFLDAIARVAIEPGSYQPMQDHTDDYPCIELAFHLDLDQIRPISGIALLFTESQGTFHAPWGACLDGQLFNLPTEHVGRALASIYGSLKRRTFDRMME